MRVGAGLWTMQSTHDAPAPHPALYRRLVEDARVVAGLGFDSLWTAEHRGWYDGWCPAPLHALAHVAGAVPGLRVGTAVALAAQHEPQAFADSCCALDRLSGDRFELGIGLGHRQEEFAMLGANRADRGPRLERVLELLARVRPDRVVWIGGLAPAAIDRAARHGHGLILPQSVTLRQARDLVERYTEGAGHRPRLALLRDVWIEPSSTRAGEVRRRLSRHYAEEIGSWWRLRGSSGFTDREGMARQLARLDSQLIAGAAGAVGEALAEWARLGVELVVARCSFDWVEQRELHHQLEQLTAAVAPLRA